MSFVRSTFSQIYRLDKKFILKMQFLPPPFITKGFFRANLKRPKTGALHLREPESVKKKILIFQRLSAFLSVRQKAFSFDIAHFYLDPTVTV